MHHVPRRSSQMDTERSRSKIYLAPSYQSRLCAARIKPCKKPSATDDEGSEVIRYDDISRPVDRLAYAASTLYSSPGASSTPMTSGAARMVLQQGVDDTKAKSLVDKLEPDGIR